MVFTTVGFFIHGFGAGRESPVLEVWAAPAAPKTIPEGGGQPTRGGLPSAGAGPTKYAEALDSAS